MNLSTPILDDDRLGRTAMARLDELAAFTDAPDGLTRLYLSPSHRAAAGRVAEWMEAAGLAASIDAIGNVVGRLEGTTPGARSLLIGSHIDSVRNAGKYDGPLGVVAGIEAVAELGRRGVRLPFAVEVIAFGDEEGVRFPRTLAGSRAVAGTFDMSSLALADAGGIPLDAALRAFGCDPAMIPAIARKPEDVLCYVEVHIEQGPVLDALREPLGIVTAISGASRFEITVSGYAGHAGTTPMPLRRDALAGAAEMIVMAENWALGAPELVATVGTLSVPNGATNVIPPLVRFSLDLRAPVDAARDGAEAQLRSGFAGIARRRGLGLDIRKHHDAPAVPCDPALSGRLAAAAESLGLSPPRLPSGAGHDGMAIASLCPIGMIFVRCRNGVSHNPEESIAAADADRAIRTLVAFLEDLGKEVEA